MAKRRYAPRDSVYMENDVSPRESFYRNGSPRANAYAAPRDPDNRGYGSRDSSYNQGRSFRDGYYNNGDYRDGYYNDGNRNLSPRSTNYVDGSRGAGVKYAMQPNNPAASFIKEDWSQPALLKRGVHEFDVTYRANKHKSGRLGDLYAQVDKTTREDQDAFDRLTDPHNW